ncbi:hypothetical protein [Enterobacter cancerogenus]|jgi:hypothetical protein|uniref:hypothetical protein n=1 Tax=Enterobacter cancerogenus TaxID=69218 RepID=UPI000538620B|nr:hypothetical protein [Enterobacter cancerogenus]KGT92365.1 hypothetical protein NH00_05670 [Enterobacter cancerogenus]
MKIDVDLNDNLFDEACRLAGMCCLLTARVGEEINRAQLAVELMRLLGSCMELARQYPPPLLFAIEYCLTVTTLRSAQHAIYMRYQFTGFKS